MDHVRLKIDPNLNHASPRAVCKFIFGETKKDIVVPAALILFRKFVCHGIHDQRGRLTPQDGLRKLLVRKCVMASRIFVGAFIMVPRQ